MTDETRANRYTVLATHTETRHLLEIKRSEFIGYVQRVETEEEARAFIESKRRAYHDARHVCSAFILGADRQTQRSNDDGEPAGTAGIPMLQALLARRARAKPPTSPISVLWWCAISVASSWVPVGWYAPIRTRWPPP